MDGCTSKSTACAIGIDLGMKTSHAVVVRDGSLLEGLSSAENVSPKTPTNEP